jgi:membrane protein implicated in regulation of membrane protease activity
MVDRTEGSSLIAYGATGWPIGPFNLWQGFGLFLAIVVMLALAALPFIRTNLTSDANSIADSQIMGP